MPRRHRAGVLWRANEARNRSRVPSARSGTYTGDRGLSAAPQPVSQHRRFRQRRRQAGRQPSGVPPGGAGADPIPFVDGDLHAGLLQEPGGGQADHAGPDDGDLPG